MGARHCRLLPSMADRELAIELRGCSRRFGKRVALHPTDLELRPGEIVGLVGPNGAGKTTLLKLIAGFLRPDGGSVRVFEQDPFRQPKEVMARAKFAFAPPALFDELTPREHLRHLVAIGVPRAEVPRAAEIDRVLELVGLLDRAQDRVGSFSFGMRQRLVLGLALLPTPGLLVLDEPTDGLDPIGILQLRGLLQELSEQHGVAVLLSSHLLGEVEELAERMLVLNAGRTLFYGSPEELSAGSRCLRMRTSDQDAGQRLLSSKGLSVEVNGAELELPLGSIDAQDAALWLESVGLRLVEFRIHKPSLESSLLKRIQAAEVR